MAVSVLLVDPAEAHLAGLLAGGGLVVLGGVGSGEAGSGEAAADVVLVDLDGGASGITTIETLTAARPELPVLALSVAAGAAAVLGAVRAGASGYLLRPVGGRDLVDAVRRTAAGQAVFTPGLAAAVLDEFGAGGVGAAVRLTGREADVLRLVVGGLTARQIAHRLVVSPRTVENHVQHMLRKTGMPNRAALVRYAIENGLA